MLGSTKEEAFTATWRALPRRQPSSLLYELEELNEQPVETDVMIQR